MGVKKKTTGGGIGSNDSLNPSSIPAMKSAYTDLIKFNSVGDYEKALKCCNRILHLNPKTEIVAFTSKLACLLHLGKFEGVLDQVKEQQHFVEVMAADNKDEPCFVFERAYALYRLNKIEEATSLLNDINPSSLRCQELRAQLCYRVEDYASCVNEYERVDSGIEDDDDFQVERLSNKLAALSFSRDGDKLYDLKSHGELSYEVLYNYSCHQLTLERWRDAEKSLDEAEQILLQSLKADKSGEDEDDVEEYEEELNLIRAQKGFALQMRAATEEVKKSPSSTTLARTSQILYANIIKCKRGDPSLVACVSNNSACWNGLQNIFDSKKKMRVAISPKSDSGVEVKLNKRQKAIIHFNNVLLTLHSNQVDQCLSLIQDFRDTYENNDQSLVNKDILEDLFLVEVALKAKNNKVEEAIDLLQKRSINESKDDDGVVLCEVKASLIAAQIYLERRQFDEAFNVLISLSKSRQSPSNVESVTVHPALLGLIFSLSNVCSHTVDTEKSIGEVLHSLNESEWWRSEPGNVNFLHNIWLKMAKHYTDQEEYEKAVGALNHILKTEGVEAKSAKNLSIIAQIVLLTSQYDMKKAELARKNLPDLASAQSTLIDVSELDSVSFNFSAVVKMCKSVQDQKQQNAGSLKSPRSVKGTPGGGSVSDSKGDQEAAKNKTKRRRKVKLPKNYNPHVLPDPERWIPKRERTGYRKPRKDRRQVHKFTGAQGVGASAGDQVSSSIDYSQRVVSSNQASSSNQHTSPKSAHPGGGGRPRQVQKKKGTKNKNRF